MPTRGVRRFISVGFLAYRDLTDRLANVEIQSDELNGNLDEMKTDKSQLGNDVSRTRELQLEIQEQLICEKQKGSLKFWAHLLFLTKNRFLQKFLFCDQNFGFSDYTVYVA